MSRKHLAFTIVRWIFFVVSILYVADYARGIFDQHHHASWLNPAVLGQTAAAALVFSTTALFSVAGWRNLLARLSHPLPFARVGSVLCLTQIAKYLPGNVGHFIGRVTLARTSLGIPVATTMSSLAQESALISLSALLIGTMCYIANPALNLPADIFGIDSRVLFVSVITAGFLALAIANRLRNAHARIKQPMILWILRTVPSWHATSVALLCYLPMYLINGLAVALIASALLPIGPSDMILLTAAYSLSWVAGFLLPGAPGGLGVREAALLLLLGNAYGGDVILAITALSRMATVFADILIFLAGMVLRHGSRT